MASTRTTIAQIVPELDTGGAEVTTLEVTEAIVKAGGRALVLTEGGRLARHVAEAGGEVLPFPAATKNPVRILWNVQRLRKIIDHEQIDLVHARSRAPAWSALLAARGAGLPFVTTYHGAYREAGRLKKFYNGVMARADIVIANSRFTAQSIRARYGKRAEDIAVIYRGVDLERFAPERISANRIAALRATWNISPSQRVILHAARLSPIKGQSIVIESARLLKERGALGDAIFVMAGDAQGRTRYAEALAAQIHSAGLAAHVRLVGHLDDMPAGLATAHVALMVSTEPEGFGRVAAEAQAMGCPVIVTDIGALPEIVLAAPCIAERDITGWVVKPGDAAALADAVCGALSLPETARLRIARNARLHIASRYSAFEMQRGTLAVYDRLLRTSLASSFRAQAQAGALGISAAATACNLAMPSEKVSRA